MKVGVAIVYGENHGVLVDGRTLIEMSEQFSDVHEPVTATTEVFEALAQNCGVVSSHAEIR